MFLVKDDFSRYSAVYFMRSKNDVFKYFKQYLANHRFFGIPPPVETVRTNDAAEFKSGYFANICRTRYFLKKNQKAPRLSEHPPVRGGEISKRLGGIKGCKYKTSSWHLNGLTYCGNIGSTV